jgi:hypothetical protein
VTVFKGGGFSRTISSSNLCETDHKKRRDSGWEIEISWRSPFCLHRFSCLIITTIVFLRKNVISISPHTVVGILVSLCTAIAPAIGIPKVVVLVAADLDGGAQATGLHRATAVVPLLISPRFLLCYDYRLCFFPLTSAFSSAGQDGSRLK